VAFSWYDQNQLWQNPGNFGAGNEAINNDFMRSVFSGTDDSTFALEAETMYLQVAGINSTTFPGYNETMLWDLIANSTNISTIETTILDFIYTEVALRTLQDINFDNDTGTVRFSDFFAQLPSC
jgi:hypothetical protein